MATKGDVPVTGHRTGPKAEWGSAVMVGGTAFDYYMRRKQGEAAIPALAKATVGTAFYNMVPWAFGAQLAYGAAKGLAYAVPNAGSALIGMTQGAIQGSSFGGRYQDTQAAATMRQRGVMSIQSSVMNSRSTLGQEARMMNRG